MLPIFQVLADNTSAKLVLCFFKRGDKQAPFLLAYKSYLILHLLYECVLYLEEEEENEADFIHHTEEK